MSEDAVAPEGEAARETLRRLLGKKLRCTLSDGRVVVGDFHALDKLKNFILVSCEETRMVAEDLTGNECVKRKLGMVMVPGKHLVSCEVEKKVWGACVK
mmetsp:Transcript_14391/g.34039  ORF Transcript_14391/g.34039 Transcript_14391/m.34039 type:complete len:99 (-) Transcript_14391:380-676(-)|eukprot:CAMPEP_0172625666 /NCGR_PEP_ID=MMETSP1068-20121228/145159_1 /TAXON_ID=35684 /ORGANISM="Pseudopedinella elastica, Strain CCMP716" /LENGTH=98 /DNA_ID=CAMNT_0013435029 /DNA_START=129 /DNA_END=425 /DNA_ORIENTATION=+